MNEARFTIRKSVLYKELIKIQKTIKAAYGNNVWMPIEFTIIDNFVILVIPGIKLELPCKTVSTVKFSIEFYYFKEIIKHWKTPMIEFVITDKLLTIDKSLFNVQTTFFENDTILRSITLPINYTNYHLLQLEPKGFTLEELRFNKLEFEVFHAKRNLTSNIRKTINLLGMYGVTKKEIEELVQSKIQLF